MSRLALLKLQRLHMPIREAIDRGRQTPRIRDGQQENTETPWLSVSWTRPAVVQHPTHSISPTLSFSPTVSQSITKILMGQGFSPPCSPPPQAPAAPASQSPPLHLMSLHRLLVPPPSPHGPSPPATRSALASRATTPGRYCHHIGCSVQWTRTALARTHSEGSSGFGPLNRRPCDEGRRAGGDRLILLLQPLCCGLSAELKSKKLKRV